MRFSYTVASCHAASPVIGEVLYRTAYPETCPSPDVVPVGAVNSSRAENGVGSFAVRSLTVAGVCPARASMNIALA